MDPVLLVALGIAGLLIGATGTWSPCGFSMIHTIGPTGHTGGQPTTLAACATFLPGALIGAVLTFGGLSLAGAALPGEAGWVSYTIAGTVALLAAVAEARGRRIAPQIRRQLPEHWRRVMPMPVAAALYGVLLGLGFTTFVLTFGVWALAGISLALGEPVAGLVIGLGFGVGRAIPIVALAPFAAHSFGKKAINLMAERPELYRAIRFGDAIALVAAAVALAFAGTAQAGVNGVDNASDPSVSGDDLAYAEEPNDAGFIADGGPATELPGTDPSISKDYVAVLDGDSVLILARADLAEIATVNAPEVDAVAISDSWLVYRTRDGGDDQFFSHKLNAAGEPGQRKSVDSAKSPSQLSLPSVDGSTLVFAVNSPKRSKIFKAKLNGGDKDTILKSRESQFVNPSVLGEKLLFSRGTAKDWELRIKKLNNDDLGKVLESKDKRIWSTALGADRAYYTLLKGSKPDSKIESVGR